MSAFPYSKCVVRELGVLPGFSGVAAILGWQTSWFVGWDSIVSTATCYGGVRFSVPRPDQPWGPPNLLYNGYWVLPGGKAARAWR
jgi:hypothetical protein